MTQWICFVFSPSKAKFVLELLEFLCIRQHIAFWFTGISSAGAGVGVLIMAPLAALFLQLYDWRNALVMLTGLLLNSMVAGALLRPIRVIVPRRFSSLKTDVEGSEWRNSSPEKKENVVCL